ncbi:DUF1127 domain-containing protein [Pelagibius litoralis]|uniref:DUF1127 domain-containing protein n=1 Tax=Pelagibius litoralis TaxID=374515 RepID=A0A967EYA5_9PROT|nr:DUF1127 domain-containing protein [Pelagibius litoralis]NIA69575.1 DUF1127 domain-containing protein [Pelagibius litoralis]
MSNAILQRSDVGSTGHGQTLGGLFNVLLRLPLMLLDLMIDWQQRSEDRATMTRLSDDQMHDIGLTREELMTMAGKSHWSRHN